MKSRYFDIAISLIYACIAMGKRCIMIEIQCLRTHSLWQVRHINRRNSIFGLRSCLPTLSLMCRDCQTRATRAQAKSGVFLIMGAYSYLHDKTYHAIKNIYPEMVIRENLHPDWLISKNGTRLEIDLYLESMNIAIEIQGIQHYEFTPRFHKTYQDFISQKDRDEQKRNLCYGNKVRLVEIASGIDLNIFIRELVSKSAQEKADEPKYFYQEKEKKVKEAGRSMLRFASVRRKIKRRQLIRMGLLPRPVIHEFGKLPGSQVQRCHAKKDLESYKTQEGNWIVWGGRNTHILTYNDNKLVCDCWHAQTVKTICSHIIKIMMDEGTFPSRESMLRTRQ